MLRGAILLFGLAACGPGEELSASRSNVAGVAVAHSFHIVTLDSRSSWDAISAITADPGPIITSQNRPAELPASRWAQNLSVLHFATAAEMANAVDRALSDPAAAPARVMIDELRGAEIDRIAEFARVMSSQHSQHRGRWGVYLVNGKNISYARLNPAIDALLDAGAAIAVELYPQQGCYCAAGSDSTERDRWLTEFYRGTSTQARVPWLMNRKRDRRSDSRVSILFGVTDRFMNGSRPANFLDRMFYVWAKNSGYRSLMLLENGGVGAWKWDRPANSNTSRDLAFQKSFEHYVRDEQRTSRLGDVDCSAPPVCD